MNIRQTVVAGACVLALTLCMPLAGFAQKGRSDNACKVSFSVSTVDTLNNVNQGLSKSDASWFQKKIQKKYPDVCYVAPGPGVSVFFFVAVTPAVYHGTRVVTTTSKHEDPLSGTVTDDQGNRADVDGTVTRTTESSTTVPYTVDYGLYTLTISTAQPGGTWKPAHRFQQKGLYHLYTIPLGSKGYHPLRTVIEEAAKWIHAGGLSDPTQTALPPSP